MSLSREFGCVGTGSGGRAGNSVGILSAGGIRICVALVCFALVAACTGPTGRSASPSIQPGPSGAASLANPSAADARPDVDGTGEAADPGEWAIPTGDAIDALADDLDGSPPDIADELMDIVYGPDAAAANVATAEVLRRSGFPLVSTQGPVIAMPDGLVAANLPLYVEFVPMLAGALRKDAVVDAENLAGLLETFGVTDEPWPAEVVVTVLSQWGKSASDPAESQFAGAAVRASAYHRGQLLVPGDDDGQGHVEGEDGIELDPLAQLLLLGHLAAQAVDNTGADPVGRPAGFRRAGDAECEAVDDFMTNNPNIGGTYDKVRDKAFGKAVEVAVEAATELLKATTKSAAKAAEYAKIGKKLLGPLNELLDVGPKLAVMALLLTGITAELEDDNGGLVHFAHYDPNSNDNLGFPLPRAEFTGVVTFTSPVPQQVVHCFALAGVKVPPNGPLKGSDGYRASWQLDRATDLLRVAGRDAQKSAESVLLEENGETTSILTYTRTEKNVPSREVLQDEPTSEASSRVRIILNKSRVNKSMWDWADAILSNALLWDYALSLMLPNFSWKFPVEFHAPDMYEIRGSGYIGFPILGHLNLTTDLYSCTGPAGPYHGSAGLHASAAELAEFMDSVLPEVNGLMTVADGLTNGSFGGAQINVTRTEGDTEGGWDATDLEVTLPGAEAGTTQQALLADDIGLSVAFDAGFDRTMHVDGPVGTASWTISGSDTADMAASAWPFQSGLTFHVVGVPTDSRCPGGESEWIHIR